MNRNEINEKIRAAKIAISEAEMAGVRGEAMISLKRQLRILKEAHAQAN